MLMPMALPGGGCCHPWSRLAARIDASRDLFHAWLSGFEFEITLPSQNLGRGCGLGCPYALKQIAYDIVVKVVVIGVS